MTSDSGAFEDSALIYDLIYGDKDSDGEARWIGDQLRRHRVPATGRLLELGAGTGRHARLLADSGYTVTAVDPSVEMLSHSIPHPRVTYSEGNGQNLRLESSFDAVLALFHVVSYQTTLEAAHSFFSTAAAHLDSGGIFAFDVWYSPAVIFQQPEARVLIKENELIRVTRKASPIEDIAQSRVDVHYSYSVEEIGTNVSRHFDELHSMRHFTIAELELLGSGLGFSLIDSREFMSDRQPSRDTWGVWFAFRKN